MCTSYPFADSRPALAAGSVLRTWPRLQGRLRQWRARARSRRALAQLNEHLLRDIGLDRATAWRESRRPFWR